MISGSFSATFMSLEMDLDHETSMSSPSMSQAEGSSGATTFQQSAVDGEAMDVEGSGPSSITAGGPHSFSDDATMRDIFWVADGGDDETSSNSSSNSEDTAPGSPTPSFVRLFGWCTCDGCQQRVHESTFYPPGVREQKIQEYENWVVARLNALEEARLERKERYTTHLLLKRRRAQDVVGEMFGLDAEERREWDEKSYDRWWRRVEGEVERRASVTYESSYPI